MGRLPAVNPSFSNIAPFEGLQWIAPEHTLDGSHIYRKFKRGSQESEPSASASDSPSSTASEEPQRTIASKAASQQPPQASTTSASQSNSHSGAVPSHQPTSPLLGLPFLPLQRYYSAQPQPTSLPNYQPYFNQPLIAQPLTTQQADARMTLQRLINQGQAPNYPVDPNRYVVNESPNLALDAAAASFFLANLQQQIEQDALKKKLVGRCHSVYFAEVERRSASSHSTAGTRAFPVGDDMLRLLLVQL
ncbi:uncharacterized protein VTP21DRAFT_9323 [Calcarisporiella thermophila]|uniref:uncharacterized protein n=1 Tax=Calcarisporiella thermophila TaxID=911321 RepID=UPI0037448199